MLHFASTVGLEELAQGSTCLAERALMEWTGWFTKEVGLDFFTCAKWRCVATKGFGELIVERGRHGKRRRRFGLGRL
jgi:hypothetical protein